MFPHTKPPAGTQINPLHPLSRGLVRCWLFNEGAGSLANDISGNKNHGRLTNMAPNVQGSGWDGSQSGGGLDFDGVNDYVDCGDDASLNGMGAITIEVCAKTSDFDTNFVFCAKDLISTSDGEYGLMVRTDKSIRLYYGLNNFISTPPNTYPTDENWHHIVMTYDNDKNGNIYLDGTNVKSDVGTITLSSYSNIFSIGNNQASTIKYNLNGSISRVRIWDNTKSTKDAKQLYEDPFCMMMKRPINRYYTAVGAGFQNRAAMMMMGLM